MERYLSEWQLAPRIHDKHGGVLEGTIGFGSFSSLTHLLGCGFGGRLASLDTINPASDITSEAGLFLPIFSKSLIWLENRASRPCGGIIF